MRHAFPFYAPNILGAWFFIVIHEYFLRLLKIKACDYRLKRGQPVRQAVANGILADSHIAGTKIFNHINRRDTTVAGDFGDKNLRQLINPCLNFGSAFFRVNVWALVGALRRNDFYCFAIIILFKNRNHSDRTKHRRIGSQNLVAGGGNPVCPGTAGPGRIRDNRLFPSRQKNHVRQFRTAVDFTARTVNIKQNGFNFRMLQRFVKVPGQQFIRRCAANPCHQIGIAKQRARHFKNSNAVSD